MNAKYFHKKLAGGGELGLIGMKSQWDLIGHIHIIFLQATLGWLQQPVQNPISDNTNMLWNSPSLGKDNRYRLPLVL